MRFTHTLLSCVLMLSVASTFAQSTAGTLKISTNTSKTGGKYTPKNIVAIWIETENGDFVKTLLAFADERITHLNNWEASTTKAGSAFNKVDAITGATKTSHGTRSCSWKGTDYLKKQVPDGKYVIKFELTDKNETGFSASVPFDKGDTAQTFTPTDKPGFSAIKIVWTPTITSHSKIKNTELNVFPNPTTGIFQIQGPSVRLYQVTNLDGQIINSGYENIVDISNQPCGVYILNVELNSGLQSVIKIVKK